LHRPARKGSKIASFLLKARCMKSYDNHLNFVDIEESPDEDDCYAEANCQPYS